MTFDGLKVFLNLRKLLQKFIMKSDKSDEQYFLEIDVQYPEKLLHNDVPFLPERMKIKKVRKLVNN